MKTVFSWWRRSNFLTKWVVVSIICLAGLVIGEKAGFVKVDSRPPRPPFDTKKCRFDLADQDYPGVSLDSLSDDIQLRIRNECSRAAIDYQGYAR